MKIIEALHLAYDYVRTDENNKIIETNRALSDLNVQIEEGSFVCVLGHNGSGKSTFAKLINGLHLPTEGCMLVSGRSTASEAELWEIRRQTGMVFQNPDNQIIGTVVEEDVAFGPENLGVPTEELWKRVEEALGAVEMLPFRHKSPNRLSGGQKQRVAIAGTLAMRPRCIVLDEPTAMLDPNGRREVIRTIHELNRREKITMVLITHYMEEAIGADRILVMDNGQLIMDGTPREIFSRVEALKAVRMDVPQVTELAWLLKKHGLALPDGVLSTEELLRALRPLLPAPGQTEPPSGQQALSAGPMQAAAPSKLRTLQAEPEQTLLPSEKQALSAGQMQAAAPSECRISSAGQAQGAPLVSAGREGQRDIVLSVNGLSHIYQKGTAMESYALADISFELERGAFVGLIGHTGSGKSTLIQHLNGLLKPDGGSLHHNFLGEDGKPEGMRAYGEGTAKAELKYLRFRVGLVFQYPEYQLFEMDVLSDVMFGPKNMGLSEAEARARAEEALRLVGLKEKHWQKSPFELSGGQKRRVAIAGVLAMQPQILILDEPTAGLDPKGRENILGQIQQLHREKGITILLVSHSMEDIAEYADRVLVLDHGRLVMNDTPTAVFLESKRLEALGLAAPQMCYVMQALAAEGYCVDVSADTVERARDEILKLCEGGSALC